MMRLKDFGQKTTTAAARGVEVRISQREEGAAPG